MKTFKSYFTVLLTIVSTNLHSQSYINTIWSVQDGNPSSVNEWSKSVIANNEIITVGNIQNVTEGINIYLSKHNEGGALMWSVELNGLSFLDDYGTDVKVKSNGEIVVVGTIHNSSLIS